MMPGGGEFRRVDRVGGASDKRVFGREKGNIKLRGHRCWYNLGAMVLRS